MSKGYVLPLIETESPTAHPLLLTWPWKKPRCLHQDSGQLFVSPRHELVYRLNRPIIMTRPSINQAVTQGHLLSQADQGRMPNLPIPSNGQHPDSPLPPFGGDFFLGNPMMNYFGPYCTPTLPNRGKQKVLEGGLRAGEAPPCPHVVWENRWIPLVKTDQPPSDGVNLGWNHFHWEVVQPPAILSHCSRDVCHAELVSPPGVARMWMPPAPAPPARHVRFAAFGAAAFSLCFGGPPAK